MNPREAESPGGDGAQISAKHRKRSDTQSIRDVSDTIEDPEQAALFGVPRARNRIDAQGRLHRDPSTSHEVANSRNLDDVTRTQRAIINTFRLARTPLTDEDLIEQLKWFRASESGLRSRRAELVRLGVLEVVDEDGRTRYGNRSRRYRIAGAD
jgi:hypothetical protein